MRWGDPWSYSFIEAFGWTTAAAVSAAGQWCDEGMGISSIAGELNKYLHEENKYLEHFDPEKMEMEIKVMEWSEMPSRQFHNFCS